MQIVDLHAEDVDVYLPEVISSIEEILGRHDVTLAAILESYEDLLKLVHRLLREIKGMRVGMPSSGIALSTTLGGSSGAEEGAEEDGAGYLSGVVPEDNAEIDGLVTDARSSPGQRGQLVRGPAALEQDDEPSDRESSGKDASPKSKTSTVKLFSSEPEIADKKSARKNDIAAGKDSSRFSSPKIPSTVKRRSSRRKPIVESDAEDAGDDQRRGSTNDVDFEAGRRLRDRDPKRRSPQASEYLPSSPQATVNKEEKGRLYRAVAATRASSSGANRPQINANKGTKAGPPKKSQSHVSDSPIPSSSRTVGKARRGGSEEGGDESGKVVVPAKRKRSPFSESRIKKFQVMKKLKDMEQGRDDLGKK
ncbi:hypothetical protein GSI_08562 [Ganoderma sinense ZZ0214-1]|uniref:Uncharacterized protein n=1 Tax=Ganoderma sinense ZZ0214-1 TaxID=1077348 RepID=A0A2G8S463_9APHY|nr:hypothetical protein GSI_08562 [Ganoderma sinense ZZ0214-1]